MRGTKTGVLTQGLSGLSRDTEHANDGSISPIFDKEKEQRRLKQAQLVNDVATQALDVYNTYEATRATRAATASLANTDSRTVLEAQAKAMLDKAHERDPKVDNGRQAVVSKAWQMAYDQAIVQQGADMGGSVRTGVNAVVNALQALAGGDIRAALAQGAAPYLAAKVKELTTDNAPYSELTNTQKVNNLMAHALLGGVVAELSGGSAAAGATGAVTGELAAPAIALALYGTADSSKLNSDQKANLSALATLASGIAAGVSSGNTAGAATGALAGKNAVENNALNLPGGLMSYGAAVKSWNQYAEANGLTPEQKQAGLNRIAVGEGPSWGTEYKVKPNGKIEVSGGVGLALKGGFEINNDYFAISTGYTKEFGIKAGASIGIDFGPYFPGLFGGLNRDYSTSVGFGPGSVGISGGKDGIGISFSIGPSIGFTGSTTGSHDEKIDLNGDSTKEIYHYDFN